MVNRLFKRPSLRLSVVLAIATVAIAGAGIAGRATLMNRSAYALKQGQVVERVAPQSERRSARATVPSHVLVLRPSGFEPSEVSWPKGRFFLSVDNHTDAREITLQLSRENGSRVHEVTRKSRKERGVGILDLPPGEYLLTEANHSNWVCRITITPQ